MKYSHRILAGLAAAGMALTFGGPITAAHADGDDTPRAVVAAIEAQPWVTLKEGDRGYRVQSVRCILHQFGFKSECDPKSDGDIYDDSLVDAVEDYQESRELDKDGKVNDETWTTIRADVGIVRPGDNRPDLVRGLQSALTALDEDIAVDGVYGPKTEQAVRNFQKRKEIDVDGVIGPQTFRAMFAKGAELPGTPR